MRRWAIDFDSLTVCKATFIKPMECLSVSKLPEGEQWVYEVKLDGYRAVAVKADSDLTLYSRQRKVLNKQFPEIVAALRELPPGMVVDGEIVALDDAGQPAFNLPQNFRSDPSKVCYYVFDLLCWRNRDTTRLNFLERRALVNSIVGDIRDPFVRISDFFETPAAAMLSAVREQNLGVVGKRKDSRYEPGKRTGAWVKHRAISRKHGGSVVALGTDAMKKRAWVRPNGSGASVSRLFGPCAAGVFGRRVPFSRGAYAVWRRSSRGWEVTSCITSRAF
jgi:ATP-dependent DNA ligase